MRAAQRAEWGLANGERLIVIVGRIDPQKDHATFLRAAAHFLKHHGPARFALVGDGPAVQRDALKRLASELGLDAHLLWQRDCPQVERIYNAADLCVSTSRFGEGFPNVIAEAMACATPCAVTDCGDSPRVLGEAAGVAPICDPPAIAATWSRALARPRETAGSRLRKRVEETFSVSALVAQTGAALLRVARGEAPLEQPAQA
jgi:glycosyltransferase involved in cell wall biosynthesis